MKLPAFQKSAFIILIVFTENYCGAQSMVASRAITYPSQLNAIQKIDSVASEKNISGHFAGLYQVSMKNIETDIEKADSNTKSFIRKFELRFADYFLNACIEQKKGQLLPASPWKTYFSNPGAQHWQLVLLGVNAHVNIDLHQALTDEFSEQEIRSNKRTLLKLQSAITKGYDPLFNAIMDDNSYLRFINTVSFGFGKKFGERTLYKWRKRQVKLAILFYRHPEKYKRKSRNTTRKKNRIDEKILRTKTKDQLQILPVEPFHQLDSIGRSNSHSNYFGQLYFQFLTGIEEQLHTRDTAAQRLIRRFEKIFADFYINAFTSYYNKEKIDLQEWQTYFSDSTLQPIQYLLLGANAHLNGGLWNALVKTFTAEEMKQLKTEFRIFKRSLNKTYKLVYAEARENQKLNNLGKASLGMDRLLGNFYLYKWRKRQMKMARTYWDQSPKFEKLVKKIDRKKRKIDQLILGLL